MGPAVVDPRSGEVISSHAIFWHDVLQAGGDLVFHAGRPARSARAEAAAARRSDGRAAALRRHARSRPRAGSAAQLQGATRPIRCSSCAAANGPSKWGTSASIMSYARFNYVAQPGDNAYLIPKFGPYDYFAIDWGYRQYGNGMTCDDEWPSCWTGWPRGRSKIRCCASAARTRSRRSIPTVNTQVLGSDPIAGGRLGLRNIDRVMAMLIPATTQARAGLHAAGGDVSGAAGQARQRARRCGQAGRRRARRRATRAGAARRRSRRCRRSGNARP